MIRYVELTNHLLAYIWTSTHPYFNDMFSKSQFDKTCKSFIERARSVVSPLPSQLETNPKGSWSWNEHPVCVDPTSPLRAVALIP
jgi:hypothetical protein